MNAGRGFEGRERKVQNPTCIRIASRDVTDFVMLKPLKRVFGTSKFSVETEMCGMWYADTSNSGGFPWTHTVEHGRYQLLRN